MLLISPTNEAAVKVTIIGAGNMGRAIGTRAVAGGNEVELIDRNPEDANALARELGESAAAIASGGQIGGELGSAVKLHW